MRTHAPFDLTRLNPIAPAIAEAVLAKRGQG
jgi:hypothetical protein